MIANINDQAIDEFDEWRLADMKKPPTQSTLMTHDAPLNRVLGEAIMSGYLNDVTRHKLEAKGKSGARELLGMERTIISMHECIAKNIK